MQPISLTQAFDPRANSLNFLRLALAALVIVSHSFPIGGFGGDPIWGGLKLGTWAVGGFFAISGYLIARSRERSSAGQYAVARALRIIPGLWVCAALTGFVLAPLIGLLDDGGWTPSAALSYTLHTMTFTDTQNTVGSVLSNSPLGAINGSLWTLRYEVLCYIAVGLAAGHPLLWRREVTLGVFVASSIASVVLLAGDRGGSGFIYDAAYLIPFYAAGTLLYRYRDSVPMHGVVAASATSTLVIGCATGAGECVAPLPTAYLMMWLGSALNGRFQRVGVPNDISYGMYVYAFPVQQVLAAANVQEAGVVAFAGLSVLATIPIAIASWLLVERPTMRAGRTWASARQSRGLPAV